jgi:hypothetical protein
MIAGVDSYFTRSAWSKAKEPADSTKYSNGVGCIFYRVGLRSADFTMTIQDPAEIGTASEKRQCQRDVGSVDCTSTRSGC